MNKYIVISGASGGIGISTCKMLLDYGFHIFALDINIDPIARISSANIFPIPVDITDRPSIDTALYQIRQHTDQIDGVINTAGYFDQFPLMEASADQYCKLINTNLNGHQLLSSALFPLLYKAKGRIINLSSETVMAQMPLQAYAFSKKLFDTWSTQVRMELALLGMKVITIRAGGHLTPIINQSVEVLSAVDDNSLYQQVMKIIRKRGIDVLNQVHNDPSDISRVILKSLITPNPKKIYTVNISMLFRMLSFLPANFREAILIKTLKSWMK